jgi:hypothetical protein
LISSSTGWYCSLQLAQIVRTSRWFRTPTRQEEIKYGSTPMSSNLMTAPDAVLVCRVENTSCPVWAALMAKSPFLDMVSRFPVDKDEDVFYLTPPFHGIALRFDTR